MIGIIVQYGIMKILYCTVHYVYAKLYRYKKGKFQMVMLIFNIEQWCSAMWMASPVWELAKDSEQHSCVLRFNRQYKTFNFTIQCVWNFNAP